MHDPRIGVVVITHDRREELLRTLQRMTALPERPPIVVVDNGSTDGTAPAVRAAHPDVQVLEPGENLGGVGRNLGVDVLDRPYIAFCDDDTWWEPGAIRHAADVLDAHPDVGVVTGHIVVEPSGADDPICAELRDSPLERPPGVPGPVLGSFLAGASVVRRTAFRDAGGFDARMFIGGEEQLLACELATRGWLMVHVPEVVVHHHPSVVRDPHLRRRQGIRNTIWFWWLRRPARAALRRTAHLLRTAPHDRVTAAGVLDALTGLPWLLRHRRVVPDRVEAQLRRLDESQMGSRARRYVS